MNIHFRNNICWELRTFMRNCVTNSPYGDDFFFEGMAVSMGLNEKVSIDMETLFRPEFTGIFEVDIKVYMQMNYTR